MKYKKENQVNRSQLSVIAKANMAKKPKPRPASGCSSCSDCGSCD